MYSLAVSCGICGGILLLLAWVIWIWSWDIQGKEPQSTEEDIAQEQPLEEITATTNECPYCGGPQPSGYHGFCDGCGAQL